MTPTERAQLIRLLDALDVPECGCKPPDCGHTEPCECFPPPCEHVRAAVHGLSLADWAELLRGVYPEHYREPPPPPERALVLTREARVRLLAQRHADGYGLWFIPRRVRNKQGMWGWIRDILPEDMDHLGRKQGLTAGNNRPIDTGLIIMGTEACA